MALQEGTGEQRGVMVLVWTLWGDTLVHSTHNSGHFGLLGSSNIGCHCGYCIWTGDGNTISFALSVGSNWTLRHAIEIFSTAFGLHAAIVALTLE